MNTGTSWQKKHLYLFISFTSLHHLIVVYHRAYPPQALHPDLQLKNDTIFQTHPLFLYVI